MSPHSFSETNTAIKVSYVLGTCWLCFVYSPVIGTIAGMSTLMEGGTCTFGLYEALKLKEHTVKNHLIS